jgi:hypothetical protein
MVNTFDMSECPTGANELNCARAAAQSLIDNEWVVIDYTAKQALGETGFCIDNKGASAAEVFNVRGLRAEGLVDIADLACIACGKCIELRDEYGDLVVVPSTEI